jgi:hypothetical protein
MDAREGTAGDALIAKEWQGMINHIAKIKDVKKEMLLTSS